MSSKKLVPVLAMALILLVAAGVAMGASSSQGVRMPKGALVTSPNASSGVVDNGRPVIPAAPGTLNAANAIVSDDFAVDSISNYQPLASADGFWKVKDGRLQQRGADADTDLSDDAAVLLSKQATFADNTLAVQVFPVAMPVGVVFRGSDAGYYRLELRRQQANGSTKAVLQKVTPAGTVEVASVPESAYAGFAPNQWQEVKVTTVGSRITVSVAGTQIMQVSDRSYTSGWAGVWAVADATTQFDNLSITAANR